MTIKNDKTRFDSLFYFSDGTFYLWETNTWTSEPWSSTSGFATVSKNTCKHLLNGF